MMEAKRRVLEFISETQVTDSASVADALGYTRAGAASTLLRLHRHGHLRRQRTETGGYEYQISPKGLAWLEWAEHA
jgi:DNA-binding IclR family transcriptional regulator